MAFGLFSKSNKSRPRTAAQPQSTADKVVAQVPVEATVGTYVKPKKGTRDTLLNGADGLQ